MTQVPANKLLRFDKNIEQQITKKGIEDISAYLDYNDSCHKLPERTEDPCSMAVKSHSFLRGQDKIKKSTQELLNPFSA